MHAKFVFLEDVIQEKVGDNQRYILAVAMFVYLSMSDKCRVTLSPIFGNQ